MSVNKEHTEPVLVSMRVEDMPEPGSPSTVDRCCECGMAVWRSNSSPSAKKAMCVRCWVDLAKPGDEIMPLTKEQIEAVRRATRDA
jgi:hypothetical protein